MTTRSLSLALLAVGLALPAARAADKVTLDDLLKQMTDLSKLAEYPDPPYVTKQFSSYDRASQTPGNESWFANADRGFMLYDGVVKEKTPYFKTAPMRERSRRRFLRRRHEGRPGPDAQAGRQLRLGLRHRPRRPAHRRQDAAGLHRPRRLHARPAGPRPGRDGRPRLRGAHLVGRPRRRRQNPHLSRRGEGTRHRGAADRVAGRQVEDERSTARRRRRSPTRSPANGRAASTCTSPSPTPSTARSRSTNRTSITTSITGRTRRGRRWRRSRSACWPRRPRRSRGVVLRDLVKRAGISSTDCRILKAADASSGGRMKIRDVLNRRPPEATRNAVPPGRGPGLSGLKPRRSNCRAAADAEVLRGLVLIATFDGAEEPQIWCPLRGLSSAPPRA